MPNGPDGFIHCKLCGESEDVKFTTISDLRKHQWAAHKERYAKLSKPAPSKKRPHGPEWAKKISAGRRKGIAARKKAGLPAQSVTSVRAYRVTAEKAIQAAVNGDMKVSVLLDELKEQQKFLNDVVGLIEGFVQQRTERKEA